MKKFWNIYTATVLGVWVGVAIATAMCRYITIPPIGWMLMIRLTVPVGVIATPVMLFLVWLAPQTWPKQRRQK